MITDDQLKRLGNYQFRILRLEVLMADENLKDMPELHKAMKDLNKKRAKLYQEMENTISKTGPRA